MFSYCCFFVARLPLHDYFAAFFAALVAAAFFGAARCAFVFVVRAATPIFSNNCFLPRSATFAIFKYCATQSFIIASAPPNAQVHRAGTEACSPTITSRPG